MNSTKFTQRVRDLLGGLSLEESLAAIEQLKKEQAQAAAPLMAVLSIDRRTGKITPITNITVSLEEFEQSVNDLRLLKEGLLSLAQNFDRSIEALYQMKVTALSQADVVSADKEKNHGT